MCLKHADRKTNSLDRKYNVSVFEYQVYQVRLGPEVIKLFSCSTQLSMIIFLLINVKMPTIVGILTFMSRKNRILGLSEPAKSRFFNIFILTSI